MSSSIYKINKGINRPIEFKGLKAQYIWYFGAGVLAQLILFALLYILGINPFLCLGIVVISGTILIIQIYRLSQQYGEHGLSKKLAFRQIPHAIRLRSRAVFQKAKSEKK